MLKLDHLTIIAPTLDEGIEHVRQCLDLDIGDGRSHPEMGTHNRRLRLGDGVYLEVISVDPAAPAPTGPRWFGLGRPEIVRSDWEQGLRLRAWVARADDFNVVMRAYAGVLGEDVSVGDGDRFSVIADGALPMGGVLPLIIDRAGNAGPSGQMREFGARLTTFSLEHPTPAEVNALYRRLDIRGHPIVLQGAAVRFRATIDTSAGSRVLT